LGWKPHWRQGNISSWRMYRFWLKVILNTGEHTHLFLGLAASSALDLTLRSPGIAVHFDRSVLPDLHQDFSTVDSVAEYFTITVLRAAAQYIPQSCTVLVAHPSRGGRSSVATQVALGGELWHSFEPTACRTVWRPSNASVPRLSGSYAKPGKHHGRPLSLTCLGRHVRTLYGTSYGACQVNTAGPSSRFVCWRCRPHIPSRFNEHHSVLFLDSVQFR
jgi:hypothetical protein